MSGGRLSESFLEAFKHMCSANGTSGSDQNQTKVRTTTTTTAAPKRAAPKAAAPTKAAPRMNYLIGTTSERATQPTNDTIVHKPTAAAEALIEHEMDPELERLRELMREQAAIYDALRARLNFLEHADACARLHQPPPQQRYHHRPVDRRYSYQSYSQAPRNTYQSHGHASFDPYTYGYGGVEYNCDGGEFVEACSGDIIVNNHYYNTCGCHESEYDSDPVGGEDADSEYGRMYPESEDPEYDAWYDEIGIHEGDPDYHDYHAESDGAEDEPERD